MVHYSSDSSSASEAGEGTPEPQIQLPQHNGDKKKRRSHTNGDEAIETNGRSESKKRRKSLTKAARDPRDEPEVKKSKKRKSTTTANAADGDETRSPSPVIDFDGLSRPSK